MTHLTAVEHEDKSERFELKINESTKLLYSAIKDMNKVYHNDFIMCLLGHYLAMQPDKINLAQSYLESSLSNKPDGARKIALCNSAINNLSNLKIPMMYPQSIIDDIIIAIQVLVTENPNIDVSGIPQSVYKVANPEHRVLDIPTATTPNVSPVAIPEPQYEQVRVMYEESTKFKLPLSVVKFNDVSLNKVLKSELMHILNYAEFEIPDDAFSYYNSEFNAIKLRVGEVVSHQDLSKAKYEVAVAANMKALSDIIHSFNLELSYTLLVHCNNREVVDNFLCANPNTLDRYLESRYSTETENLYVQYKGDGSIWSLSLSQLNVLCARLHKYQVKANFVVSAATISLPQVKLKSAIGSAYGFIFANKSDSYEFTSF